VFQTGFFSYAWVRNWTSDHMFKDTVGTKGVSQFYHLSFDDNKVLKLSIGYAKSLFKCTW